MADRTLTTTVTEVESAEPERATVRLRAHGKGTRPGDAHRAATDLAATIRNELAEQLALDGDVRTTSIDCSDGPEFGGDEPPFEATVHLSVDCLPETARDVIETATHAGATVRDVEYGLTVATRQELRREADTAAMKSARHRATAMAATEDSTVGEVLSVETDDPDGWQGFVGGVARDANGFAFEPGPIEVGSAVTVTFALE
jgi:uncharacterized protein YggE